MSSLRITVLFCVCVWVAGVAPGAYTWTQLDYPGAARTYARGVSGSTVVGGYQDGTGVHAFAYNGGDWESLSYPGPSYTQAYGISDGRIAGSYHVAGPDQSDHGFVYDGASWTSLTYPGASNTRAYGIHENRIVGYYEHGNPWRFSGFLYDGSSWTTLDYPGAWLTVATGVWGDTIVGYYMTYNYQQYGFIYDGKNWTKLGPQEGNFLMGVEGTRMVGYWWPDGATNSHGLLIDGDAWIDLQCPWGPRTDARGISGDTIVGSYREVWNGPDHGFILTIPEPGTLALLAVAATVALRRPPRQRARPLARGGRT